MTPSAPTTSLPADHSVTPELASRNVGEVLAGGVMWEHLSPLTRVREGEDPESFSRRDPDMIAELTENLLDMLVEREIDCVLVGAVAMLQYVPGRNTKDIDFIAPKSEVKRCPEITIRRQDKTFCQGQYGSLDVDFLYTSNRLFKHVAEHHSQPRQIGNRTIRVATPEGLVLLKLYAMPNLLVQLNSRKVRKYQMDIEEMIENHPVSDSAVLTKLEKVLKPGEFLAVKMLYSECRQRVEHMQQIIRTAQPQSGEAPNP